MRIFRSYRRLAAEARGAVAAIGNFDGLHLGHRVVIDAAKRIAAQHQAPSAVLTFEPHPRMVFRPGDPQFRLTPFREKATLLAEMGLDLMLVPHFDRRFSSVTAEGFVHEVLAEGLGLKHVVCGADFVFGKGRTGDVAMLAKLAPGLSMGVTVIDPVGDGETVYSSTNIRQLLQAGDPRGAARLMGRPYEIIGKVHRGDQVGRKLGFPTANVDHSAYLAPATGVYAVRAALADEGTHAARRWIDGVANFGRRPTVGGLKLLLEVHLFDFAADLYGHRLRVRFIEYIRPEKKFDSLDALKGQIAADARQAQRIMGAPRLRADEAGDETDAPLELKATS